jgi:hypothetical protein
MHIEAGEDGSEDQLYRPTSELCADFLGASTAGQPFATERQKIVKTMTKMNTRWYKVAQDYLATTAR